MKLYLSLYRVGNDTEGFMKLVGKVNAKVAVIDNARDSSTDFERKAKKLQSEIDAMIELGFLPEYLDLKDYFGNLESLVQKLSDFDMVWVTGCNSFLLRKAMSQSGFDEVIERLIRTNKLVYAGYSAGIAVIAPSLKGVELVDDPDVQVEGYALGIKYKTLRDDDTININS